MGEGLNTSIELFSFCRESFSSHFSSFFRGLVLIRAASSSTLGNAQPSVEESKLSLLCVLNVSAMAIFWVIAGGVSPFCRFLIIVDCDIFWKEECGIT